MKDFREKVAVPTGAASGNGRARAAMLVFSLLKEPVASAGEFSFGEGREVELKGLKGKHRVFEVEWV